MIGKWKVKITDIHKTSDGKVVVVYEHDFPVIDLDEYEGVHIVNAETSQKLEVGKEYYLGFEEIQEPILEIKDVDPAKIKKVQEIGIDKILEAGLNVLSDQLKKDRLKD